MPDPAPPAAAARSALPRAAAQVASCSTAAARKVSAAPTTTLRPWFARNLANLPMVVVLPTPFTPTTSTTAGRAVSFRVGSSLDRRSSRISRSIRLRSTGSVVLYFLTMRAQLPDDVVGDLRAEVGADQGVLEVLPGVLVDRLLREHAAQSAGQGPGGAFSHRTG